jgi:hypothetical protein
MTPRHRTIAAAAGLAVAFAAGACLLAGGSDCPNKGNSVARPASAPRAPIATRSSYAVVAAPAAPVAAASRAVAVPDAVLVRARELFRRLELAVGTDAVLPEEIRRDLLAFLSEGEANRAALFGLAWEPSAPKMVLGHLKLFLMGLPDATKRAEYLAAFETRDPRYAERVELTKKLRDPAALAEELRLVPSGEEKTRRIRMLPKETCSDPAVAKFLLETARGDVDAESRSAAYVRLSLAGVAEAMPIQLAAAGDDSRDVMERANAAMSLGMNPARPALEDLIALYDRSPADVRRNLLSSLSKAPSSRRVDDLLLDALVAEGSGIETRKAASVAIGFRLHRLPAEEARDLGARTAAAVKNLSAESAAEALNCLGISVVKNEPLREAVQDFHRTSPAGGAIQLAIAASPALRMVAGL